MIRPSVVALSSGSRLSAPDGEVPALIVSGGCGAGAELSAFWEDESVTVRLQPKARNAIIKNSNARDANDNFIRNELSFTEAALTMKTEGYYSVAAYVA